VLDQSLEFRWPPGQIGKIGSEPVGDGGGIVGLREGRQGALARIEGNIDNAADARWVDAAAEVIIGQPRNNATTPDQVEVLVIGGNQIGFVGMRNDSEVPDFACAIGIDDEACAVVDLEGRGVPDVGAFGIVRVADTVFPLGNVDECLFERLAVLVDVSKHLEDRGFVICSRGNRSRHKAADDFK